MSLRPAAAGASQAAGVRANRVRTRVRTQATQPPVVVEEEGPPAFALTTDEDIQRQGKRHTTKGMTLPAIELSLSHLGSVSPLLRGSSPPGQALTVGPGVPAAEVRVYSKGNPYLEHNNSKRLVFRIPPASAEPPAAPDAARSRARVTVGIAPFHRV